MIKKIGTVAAAAGLFAATAMPAFATVNVGIGNGNSLQNNQAVVSNTVFQGANTGGNTSNTVFGAGNSISTGNASNGALVVTAANKNTNSCGCNSVNVGAFNGNSVQNNGALVVNGVGQASDTGNNTSTSFIGFGNGITTGNARNGAAVVTVVNSNVNN